MARRRRVCCGMARRHGAARHTPCNGIEQENGMARTEEGWITPPPAANERRGVAGGPTTEDVVQVLQDRFGDEYQESYENGKQQFRDAIFEAFGVERDTASALVDDLE